MTILKKKPLQEIVYQLLWVHPLSSYAKFSEKLSRIFDLTIAWKKSVVYISYTFCTEPKTENKNLKGFDKTLF